MFPGSTATAGLLTVLTLAVPLLGACSGEASVGSGDPTVTQAQLEEEVASRVTGQDADQVKVACEGDLTATVGGTQDCEVTAAGTSTGIRLTVDAVEGEEVEFSQTLFISETELASAVDGYFTDQGITVTGVTCDGELIGVKGESATCEVTSSSDGDATVRTTTSNVDGLTVGFDIELVET
ncbi:DUF4333 domain-containing protein [Nocardioides pyridinolyticus]